MIDKALLSFLGKHYERYGELIFQTCPFCGNNRNNFQVNLDKDVYHDWACGASGRVTTLLKTRGIQVDTTPWRSSNERKAVTFGTVSFKDFTPLDYTQFKKFLDSRGLDAEDVKKYNLMTCDKGQYKDKVIIPLYEGSVPAYFTARDPTLKGRYHQPKGINRKSLLLYYLGTEHRLRLYIVEGPFDGIILNKLGYSVCILTSSEMSEMQMDKIRKFGFEEVVVCLDGDLKKSSVSLCERLKKFGIQSKIILIPGDADPNDLYISDIEYLKALLKRPKDLDVQDKVKVILNKCK